MRRDRFATFLLGGIATILLCRAADVTIDVFHTVGYLICSVLLCFAVVIFIFEPEKH